MTLNGCAANIAAFLIGTAMSDRYPHTEEIEVHYPTTVMQRQFSDVGELNESLFRLVKNLEQKYKGTEHDAVTTKTVSTQGGFQTSTSMNLFMLEDEAVGTFRDELVLPAIRDYLKHVFGEESATLDPWPIGWSNVLHEGDWQGPHLHPSEKNVASAVYYVHLPEDMTNPEGHIEFINPHLASVHHGFSTTRRLEPVEGKLIVFPPYYMHYVHPFRGDGERVIISFDVLAQKPGMQLVF